MGDRRIGSFTSRLHTEQNPFCNPTMAVFIISSWTYFAISLFILAVVFVKFLRGKNHKTTIPTPKGWPIIGHLHLLRGYKVPYQAFIDLSKKFGNVYSLQLGNVPAVVVQGSDNIKEVLITKGHHFDSRPNFNRYHQLFHGNKENSLAFCNWSRIQKKRRDQLKGHVFPKSYTNNFQQLDRLIQEEISKMIEDIKDTANNNNSKNKNDKYKESEDKVFTTTNKTVITKSANIFRRNFKNLIRLTKNKHVETIVRFPENFKMATEPISEPGNQIHVKDKILPTCANIFLRYFCSTDFEMNREFQDFVENFDKIFYEVNQGYAYDFLPFLGIFYRYNMQKMEKHSKDIRKFMLKNIIKNRFEEMEKDSQEKDYVDALLKNVKFGGDEEFNMETGLFSLEDIIGGHSAIGNFLVKLMTFIVDDKMVQGKIREEAEKREKDFITLEDRPYMPYTEAVVMETLRMVSSPIVPHVSNRDTTISGFEVKKNTLVFLNNYELNMSETLWSNPRKFDPTRFINSETEMKLKPAHFLPFGGGKRSCMGYKLVQFVSFVFLANVISNFDILSVPGEKYEEVAIGNLALPTRTYQFKFRTR